MTITFILLALGSYLLGSVPAAYITAKVYHGIDIRQFGTGNIGTGNLIRATSKKLGIGVAAFDFFKGMAMILVARWLVLNETQQIVVGLAAIIGHNWPVFLRFNGGRGIVTSFGMAFLLLPWGVLLFAAAAAFSIKLKSTPLPMLAGMAALPVMSWGLGRSLALTLGMVAILLIMIIRRLTAPLTELSPSSKRELLANRMLFDRDIRDGKAWMNRKTRQNNPASKLEK